VHGGAATAETHEKTRPVRVFSFPAPVRPGVLRRLRRRAQTRAEAWRMVAALAAPAGASHPSQAARRPAMSHRNAFSLVSGALAAALMAFAPAASAQSTVVADCSFASNYCDGWADSAAPQPFRYTWTLGTYGQALPVAEDCTNKPWSSCRFYCPYPQWQGELLATLYVYDANGALIGSDSDIALCTQQDIVLP
jgi:hypothetical protein